MASQNSSASELLLQIPPQSINQFPIDKEHPEELVGEWLGNFSISLNQSLPKEYVDKIQHIQNDLYNCTIETVNSWIDNQIYFNEKTTLKLIKYRDQKYQEDRDRIYIVIRRITVRGTEILSLCRFHKNKESIYIAVESYGLGMLHWTPLIIHNLLFLSLWQLALSFGTVFSSFLGFFGLIITLFLPVLYANWIWGGVIKGLRQGDSLSRSLRQRFPRKLSDNSFDIDDTLIFLKNILPLITGSIKQAFQQNGLEFKELEDYLNEISQKIQQQSFVINTGGGNILGAIFGGNNNKIYN